MDEGNTQLNITGLLPDFSTLGEFPETPEQLSALFVAILIVIAVSFFFISLYTWYKAYYRVKWVKDHLRDETSQTVIKNRLDLRDKAKKTDNNAGHLWNEFDETLLEARVGENVHLHNIYDAEHFFNSSTLAREITESRMLAAVPGFLTALGVIGTFIGLQLGLAELNIGNDADVQEMKEGLANVIGGAKIAFMTSVWGVTLSVLFNFAEKWMESNARKRIHNLQERIDEIFPRFSAEVQLKKIAEDGSESREALQGMAERIGEKMQESLLEATSGIQRGLEASLEKIMAPAINKLVNETADGNQKALEKLVKSFMDKFGEQGESQRKAMDDASKGVNDAVTSMKEAMGGFIKNLDNTQSEAAKREKQLTEHVSEQIDGITNAVKESRKHQEERENQLKEELDRVIKGMAKSIDKQTTASNSLIEQGKILQQQIEDSLNGLKNLAQGINEGASQLRTAAVQLREYGEGVQNSSEKLSGAIHEAAESTADLASENKKSTTAVGQIHQQISNDIDALNNVVEKLDSVVRIADSTFGHMEEHQKNYLSELKKNVEELAEQGSQLLRDYAKQANAQTSEHLRIWVQHSTAYAEKMNNAVNALSNVVDEIEDKVGS